MRFVLVFIDPGGIFFRCEIRACAVERPSTNKTQPSRRARGWATITRTDTKHHQGKKNGLGSCAKIARRGQLDRGSAPVTRTPPMRPTIQEKKEMSRKWLYNGKHRNAAVRCGFCETSL